MTPPTETFFVTFALASTIIMGLALVVAQARSQRRLRARWTEVAHRMGLEVSSWREGAPTIRGRVDGLVVKLQQFGLSMQGHSLRTRAVLELAAPLPPGLEICRPRLAGGVMRRGRERLLLGHEGIDSQTALYGVEGPRSLRFSGHVALVRALDRARRDGLLLELEGRSLQVDQPGGGEEDVAERLQLALDVARDLERAALAPWNTVAETYGLTVSLPGGGEVLLEGDLHLGLLRARSLPREQELHTEVRLQFRQPLATPLRVIAADHADAPGIRLGDPVLDGHITAHGADPEAIRRLLRREALRGPLLAILHAHPGSVLTQEALVLRPSNGEPHLLLVGIGELLELVRTLQDCTTAQEPRAVS